MATAMSTTRMLSSRNRTRPRNLPSVPDGRLAGRWTVASAMRAPRVSDIRYSVTVDAGGSGIVPGMVISLLLLPPSTLLLADAYRPALDFVTNVRPVSVDGGVTRVPVSRYMYRYSTGSKPCR